MKGRDNMKECRNCVDVVGDLNGPKGLSVGRRSLQAWRRRLSHWGVLMVKTFGFETRGAEFHKFLQLAELKT